MSHDAPSPRSQAEREQAAAQALTQRAVFRLYLPLAVSWIFMSIETPIAMVFLGQVGGSEVNRAAFLAMMSISVWIESPVIDLLATSTTLAKSRDHYLALRRFTSWVLVWVTLAHALVSLTPLYFFVARDLLRLAPEVVDTMRMPLIMMLPWSGFIGWRRYLQGILIRHGSTSIIGWGTVCRMISMAGLGFGLSNYTELPGLVAISMALAGSVMAESMFVHVVGRPIINRGYEVQPADGSEVPLTMRKIAGFHLPLTASTLTAGLSQPLVCAALALTLNPVPAQAAWILTLSIFSPIRSITYALTEPTIALYRDRDSRRTLRRFALNVGLFSGGVILLAALTGVDVVVFRGLMGATFENARLAHMGMFACCLLPVITASMMHMRGVLTAHHQTPSRLLSICVGLAFLCGTLALGVALRWPGPIVAACGVTVAMFAEYGTLLAAWRRLSATGKLSAPSAA